MLKSKQAKMVVVELLNDSRKDIRASAAKTIGVAARLNPHMFQDAIRRLTYVLFDSLFRASRYVINTGRTFIPRLKKEYSREVLLQMTELLRSESPEVRQSAINAISNLSLENIPARNLAFQTLTVGLRDDQPQVRKQAVTGIYNFCREYSDNKDRAMPLLQDCTKDPSKMVSREAGRVIQNINK